MVVCPKCNIEYEAEKEYCKKCGSFLMAEEETHRGPGEKGMSLGKMGKGKLLCPKCSEFYRIGTYCRKCGSLLLERSKFLTIDFQTLGKKQAKRISKDWGALLREKKKLENRMTKLEAQRDSVSKEIFESISARYQTRLEALSLRHQEIKAELESMRKQASEKIHLLESEMQSLQKRFEEYLALYQSGAVAKTDFLREKKRNVREMSSREMGLINHRQILSLLPNQMGTEALPTDITRNLLQPLPLLIACGMILLLAIGGYLLWAGNSQSGKGVSKESVTSPSVFSAEDQEVEQIKTLFENIRQANLQKDIDLFMSCYSRDFKNRKTKQASTLETWKQFNYLELTYALKTKTIRGPTAHIRVEWLAKIAQKTGGLPRESRAILNVTLKKENAFWKIKEIKSVT